MLAFIITAAAAARGLTQDEAAQVYAAVQIIMTKRSLVTTITPRQAYTVLNYAIVAVIEQSRGSATGTLSDPTTPPAT